MSVPSILALSKEKGQIRILKRGITLEPFGWDSQKNMSNNFTNQRGHM